MTKFVQSIPQRYFHSLFLGVRLEDMASSSPLIDIIRQMKCCFVSSCLLGIIDLAPSFYGLRKKRLGLWPPFWRRNTNKRPADWDTHRLRQDSSNKNVHHYERGPLFDNTYI